MPRKVKTAVELASNMGANAFDLMQHSEREVKWAIHFLWDVNPELFSWLLKQLRDEDQIRSITKGKASE